MGWADADRHPSPLPQEIIAAKTAVQNRSTTAQAIVDEINVMRNGLDPDTQPPGSLGELPLVVLTAKKSIDPGLSGEESAQDKESLEHRLTIMQIEQELQSELAALSTHSQHVMVENSGHFIMYNQPDVVIQSITNLL